MTFDQMLAIFSLKLRAAWRRQDTYNENVRKQLLEQDSLIDDLRARVDGLEQARCQHAKSIGDIACSLLDSVSEVKE